MTFFFSFFSKKNEVLVRGATTNSMAIPVMRSRVGGARALPLLALLCHAWHPPAAGFAPGVAVVTGGNRGIGFEICRQLVDRGFTVVLTARDPERGERQGNAGWLRNCPRGNQPAWVPRDNQRVTTSRSARGAGHRARGGSSGRGASWAGRDCIPPAGHHGCSFHRQVCMPCE